MECLPEIDLRHVLRLTDDTGILQHATYATPNLLHGYCVDDNARAFIAAVLHGRLVGFADSELPIQRYLAFIAYAYNPDCEHFRNFMSYDRRWLEEAGSQDSHGRTIWSLGLGASLEENDLVRQMSRRFLREGAPALKTFTAPRSWAFALLGLNAYLQCEGEDHELAAIRRHLYGRLKTAWTEWSGTDWPWFEDIVAYDNAKLPHALLETAHLLDDQEMVERALTSLRWLLEIQTAQEGHLSIIGNNGWYIRGGGRAEYDQQPLEAHALVEACLLANRLTGDKTWHDDAVRCFEWFVGKNDVGKSLYRDDTGGCQDGLSPEGPNLNQGAESTLAYVLSLLALHLHRKEQA